MNKKIMFISGSSRGIGRSIALAFAQNNYHVLLNCQSSFSELEETAAQITAQPNGSCDIFTGDVGNSADVSRIFQNVYEKYNRIDVLINNAGLAHIGLLTDMSDKEWHRIIQTNLDSVFYCSRAVLPQMIRQKEGRIINISSMWGTTGASCEAAYSAAKAGVHGLTRALAKELAPSNIPVNAVACGVIDTRMNAALTPDDKASLAEEIPAGRFGTPEEVASLVLSLVEAPSYLTGQIIGLDGGYL